jgi:DNA-binding transcriptional MocR family regulator
MNTAAWQHLGALERATYVEIASRYNGSNNGQIGYSIRDIAEVFGVGKSTAARAFKLLEDTGFIVCASKGGFNRKIRHSTEWRLTEFDCNVTGEIASKAFARWSPSVPVEGQQKQITVPPQVRMVPTKGPIGIYSGTIEGEKPSIGTHSRTVSPD